VSGPKSFEALRARAALAGLQVLRTDPADGWVRYFVVQRQTVRELQTLDDLDALVAYVLAR
jgi:hypothetical protein